MGTEISLKKKRSPWYYLDQVNAVGAIDYCICFGFLRCSFYYLTHWQGLLVAKTLRIMFIFLWKKETM